MSIFASTDFRQIATAAIGALIVSTACVGAAVAPVKAATFAPPSAPMSNTVDVSSKAVGVVQAPVAM